MVGVAGQVFNAGLKPGAYMCCVHLLRTFGVGFRA
jgi:hypothetical protein